MFSVGDTLKRARLEQGLDLSAVAARTKINKSYLEAIESDERKKLPSGFFYRSFVDQYARTLSVDTAEIEAEIDRLLADDAPLPLPGQDGNPIHRVEPITIRTRFSVRRMFTSLATLILVILACSGIYAWWHDGGLPMRLSIDVRVLPDLVRSPRVVEAAKPADDTNSSTVAMPVQVPSPRAAKTQASTAPTAPRRPVQSKSAGIADPKVLLDLKATEATWLSVSSDGRPVFSGILARNQTKIVEGKQFAKVTIGNAAGLDVRLNGRPLGPLGARGQVLVVLFTPDNFQIVTAAKEGD